jgi:tight adherence protein B
MTFIAVLSLAAAAVGLLYLFRSIRRSNPAALGLRLARYGMTSGGVGGSDVSQLITPAVRQQSEQSAISRGLERAVGGTRFGAGIAARLDRADIKMTAGEWVAVCMAVLVIFSLAGIVIFSAMGHSGIGLLVGLVLGVAAPQLYIRRKIKKRQSKFLEQLADMAQMMGNSMRAGFSILQSMELVGTEGPVPAGQEFDRVVTEVKLGLPLEAGLEHMLQRMPSEDLELLVVAINVQRQVGGNLAEILMIMAKLVRERVRFQRDLKTLTAQVRLSSWIITALPIAVALAITFIDYPYESYLFTHATGNIMIGVALVMIAVGFFFLSRIADIEV